ncbi:MAG: FecR domain-containing protein [Ardenticatenales bacterium]|nr:FecR domain-containing protein [Ardenticatenales bacterium]
MNDPVHDPEMTSVDPHIDADADAASDIALDALIDRAAARVAADDPSDAVVQAAVERTWARLQGADAQMGADGATDYRSLIPTFLSGGLSSGQRMLLADHMRENPAFRAEVEAQRTGSRRLDLTAVRGGKAVTTVSRWTRGRVGAVAATLALAAGVGAFVLARDLVQPNRVLAQVADIDGALVTLADADGAHPLAVGDAIRPRQALRAAGGGAVVTLHDGSKLELDDRSQVSLRSRWDGLAIHLDRGNVIVQASEQGSGHLVVETDDLGVSVQGTVFSVRHGTKGSRVSVVEGAVKVSGAAGARTLGGGEQYVSNAAVGTVPVIADFSWSRDKAHYGQLLGELAQLGQEIDEAVEGPAPRKASALLDRLPSDTAVVVALPNLGPTLAEKYKLFESRVAAYPALAEWWSANMADPEDKARLDALIEAVAKVGDQVGDEVLVSVRFGADGEPAMPVVLAAVADEAAFRRELEARFADLSNKLGDGGDPADAPALSILTDRAALDAAAAVETARDDARDATSEAQDGAADAADGVVGSDVDGTGDDAATDADAADDAEDRLQVWIGGGIVAASPAATSLQGVVGTGGGLDAGFEAAVDAAYARGIDALVAVDLQRIVTEARAAARNGDDDGAGADAAREDADEAEAAEAAIDFTGMAGARYFVLSQVEVDGRSQLEADATFDGPRTGVAGWLAAPGPMGALDFVSPDAYVAGAAVIEAPERIVAQFLGLADKMGDARDRHADGGDGAGTSVDPHDDFTEADEAFVAATLTQLANGLGGEVAFAVDGPLLPKPAWKMIVEVDDAAAVQAAISAAVAGINERMKGVTSAGAHRLALTSAETSGRTVWSLSAEGVEELGAATTGDRPTVRWLYADGYLLAAADAPLLLQALKTRDSGVSLIDAPAFRAALPSGAETDFSALVWQDISRLTKVMAGGMSGAGAGDGAEDGNASGTGGDAAAAAEALSEMAGKITPSLIYAWADADRLRFAASSDMSPFGLGVLLQLLGGAGEGGGPSGPGMRGVPGLPGLPFDADVDIDAGGNA